MRSSEKRNDLVFVGNLPKGLRGLSDAVSIAIFLGIVLMLAAVIGGYALSKVPSGSAPTATLAIQAMGNTVVISHNGGDGVPFEHLRIYVYDRDLNIVSGYPQLASTMGAKSDSAPTGVFNNGDNIRITGLGAGTYRVSVEYLPTQQMIASAMVTVAS